MKEYNGYQQDGSQLQSILDEAMKLQKMVWEQGQVLLHGDSVNTGVAVGKVIMVENRDGEYFGSFRVTRVSHSYEQRGKYRNTFEAVPMDIDIYPLTDVNRYLTARPEMAVVTDTADPLQMSRVKVEFPWQRSGHQTTPWLRVATPYAGDGRGMHFIPEVGDTVVVGYEHGNVERPYVQAALYNGNQKFGQWQSDSNNHKGFATRGGHMIEMDDTKDGERITITDKNSNMIQLDTTASSIVITAPEHLVLQAKNIDVRATEHIRVAAGKNKMVQIGGNYMLEAKNIFESASDAVKSKADKIVQQSVADLVINSTEGNVNKEAAKKNNNNSGDQSNIFLNMPDIVKTSKGSLDITATKDVDLFAKNINTSAAGSVNETGGSGVFLAMPRRLRSGNFLVIPFLHIKHLTEEKLQLVPLQ